MENRLWCTISDQEEWAGCSTFLVECPKLNTDCHLDSNCVFTPDICLDVFGVRLGYRDKL